LLEVLEVDRVVDVAQGVALVVTNLEMTAEHVEISWVCFK
jgi:hypothetical protein